VQRGVCCDVSNVSAIAAACKMNFALFLAA
jgi:hypothetical protein